MHESAFVWAFSAVLSCLDAVHGDTRPCPANQSRGLHTYQMQPRRRQQLRVTDVHPLKLTRSNSLVSSNAAQLLLQLMPPLQIFHLDGLHFLVPAAAATDTAAAAAPSASPTCTALLHLPCSTAAAPARQARARRLPPRLPCVGCCVAVVVVQQPKQNLSIENMHACRNNFT
jgi:hypothetical protein